MAKRKTTKKAVKKATRKTARKPAKKAAKRTTARRGAKKTAIDLIISKSRTKAAADLNVSGEFYGALDARVREIIAGAEARAADNGRKTLRPYDL